LYWCEANPPTVSSNPDFGVYPERASIL
jgi:hypothetical protein